MSLRTALIDAARISHPQQPWPRIEVDAETWRQAVLGIAAGEATLVALWAEKTHVHLALVEDDGALLVVSLVCPDGHFPSVGLTHAPGQRPERTIRDVWGLVADGAPDERRWLDHGRWPLRAPLGQAAPHDGSRDPYTFLEAEGPPLHQIAVGPVHAGIIEPGHFRFSANGEIIVRLEERLGYVHKGVDSLMRGASLETGGRLAARLSGDSTVAWSFAYARAAEAALGLAVPQRAVWLRALMAELERIANHLGDIGAIANDAAFALLLAHAGMLREEVLRACKTAFGHRLMMDRVVVGGTGCDLADAAPIRAALAAVHAAFPQIVEVYDETTSLQNRTVTTGFLAPELARRFGAGGPVGRASGRAFDARKCPGYAPYGDLAFDVVQRDDGDVNARVWVRIDEVKQSLALVGEILERLPEGPVLTSFDPAGATEREGLAMVESFRGDVFVWLRLAADGSIAASHVRDPSVFQWPLLEAVVEDNIVADFPLCNKSFNCSYSGHDL